METSAWVPEGTGLRCEWNEEEGWARFSVAGEHVRLDAWGRDGLRVRSSPGAQGPISVETIPEDRALCACGSGTWTRDRLDVSIGKAEDGLSFRNGRIRCVISPHGILSFLDGDRPLFQEDFRDEGALTRESSCLKRPARQWKGISGASECSLRVSFQPSAAEMLFGMGQYQHQALSKKGCALELAQRNSQVSVPFLISSLGYGFLWNNPAVGTAWLGMDRNEWTAQSTREMDYWVCAAPTPREILERYTAVTGRAPKFPDELLGLWQCKLRYRTQDEVLAVARECRERGLDISCIVVDFFHWTAQGDYDFDRRYWPDPAAMVRELHELGIRVLVSVWPSVDMRSRNWDMLYNNGWLLRWDSGDPITYTYQGQCGTLDLFNPDAARWFRDECLGRYLEYGVDGFWLDNCEPDLERYDFPSLRYSVGPASEISCMYGQVMSRLGHEALEKARQKDPARTASMVNLVRSGWAGSQTLSNVFWSGDVPSTFEAFSDQVQCGISMGVAGIPWWTTDIGGFLTPDCRTPEFRELLIRWFQYATFTPVLRMHGNRGPHDIPPLDDVEPGGGYLFTGQPNELWSYGDDVYQVLRAYLELRTSLKPYISGLFDEASRTGMPLIRGMFLEFPDDDMSWLCRTQYMFGPKYLVAPVMALGERKRKLYLPEGGWRLLHTGGTLEGPRLVEVDAPLERIPVLERLE